MAGDNLISLTSDELELADEVLALYDLPEGERHIFRNTTGFVNKTFIVKIENETFVLRQSNPWDTTTEHLGFEIEILRFLENAAYKLTPRIIQSARGEYLTQHENSYFMLQTFLPGKTRASWDDTDNFEGVMLENFFRTLADFTHVARDFTPSKPCSGFSLMHYVTNSSSLFSEQLAEIPDSPAKAFLSEKASHLLQFATVTLKELEALDYDHLPKQLVHFDLHPGNVHYEGDRIVALFDFDWARMDCRISDLAGSISQSCYKRGDNQSGLFSKEKIQAGLAAYRDAYGKSEYSLEEENRIIKAATKAYTFYLLIWTIGWYRENREHKDALSILRQSSNMCLTNDFDSLFHSGSSYAVHLLS